MKKIRRSIINLQHGAMSVLVREATSNARSVDPSVIDQLRVAFLTRIHHYSPLSDDPRHKEMTEALALLWKRLTDIEQELHVVKALTVYIYLLKDERLLPVLANFAQNKRYQLEQLTKYSSPNATLLVSQKAHELAQLLDSYYTRPSQASEQKKLQKTKHPKPKVPPKPKQIPRQPAQQEQNPFDFPVPTLSESPTPADPVARDLDIFVGLSASPDPEPPVIALPSVDISSLFGEEPAKPVVMPAMKAAAKPTEPNLQLRKEKPRKESAFHGLLGDLGHGFDGLTRNEERERQQAREEAEKEARRRKHAQMVDASMDSLFAALDSAHLNTLSPLNLKRVSSEESPSAMSTPVLVSPADSCDQSWAVVSEDEKDKGEHTRVGGVASDLALPEAMESRLRSYGAYINKFMEPHSAATGVELLAACVDGLLLVKMVTALEPEAVDLRVCSELSAPNMVEADRQGNLTLAVEAVASLGIPPVVIDVETLSAGGVKDSASLVALTDLLGAIVKSHLQRRVLTVRAHPEIIQAINAGLDENKSASEVEVLCRSQPQKVQALWASWLHKSEITSRVYSAEWYNTLFFPDKKMNDADLVAAVKNQQPPMAVSLASLSDPTDPCHSLYTLSLLHTKAPVANTTQHIELVSDEKMELSSGDAHAFTLWINSLGLSVTLPRMRRGSVAPDSGIDLADLWQSNDPNEHDVKVFVHDFFNDLRDGLVLLAVISHIRPDSVDWKHVERRPRNKYKRISNCNYVVKLCKQMGLSVVNVSGVDLEQGQPKILLAVVWQLLRFHIRTFLQNLYAQHKQKMQLDSEKDVDGVILGWINRVLTQKGCFNGHLSSMPRQLMGFAEPQLKSSLLLLDLLYALNDRAVNWEFVDLDATTPEGRKQNASYAISVARRLGCKMFCSVADLVNVKCKVLLATFGGIMERTLESKHVS